MRIGLIAILVTLAFYKAHANDGGLLRVIAAMSKGNGTSRSEFDDTSKVYIIIEDGQSNDKGFAPRQDYYSGGTYGDITPALTRTYSRVRIYNPTSHTVELLDPGAAGFNTSGGGNDQGNDATTSYDNGFGPNISMAAKWEQDNSATLIIIKTAVNGSYILSHMKGMPTYTAIRTGWDSAISWCAARGKTPIALGDYWCQGEADAGLPTPHYYDSLAKRAGDIEADFLNTIESPSIGWHHIFHQVWHPADSLNVPNSAHKLYVQNHPSTSYLITCAANTLIWDDIHFDAHTQMVAGQTAINLWTGAIGNIDGFTP